MVRRSSVLRPRSRCKLAAVLVLTIILMFEITPNSSLIVSTKIMTKKGHFILPFFYKRTEEEDHVKTSVIAATEVLSPRGTRLSTEDKNNEKLVHSTFRIKNSVVMALNREAQKRGVSLSNLVSKTLENYVTCEMLFEELGFLLVSKDFMRKTFNRLDKKQIEELGRDLGLTVAKEYVSYFFPTVNSDSLIKFYLSRALGMQICRIEPLSLV
jgi:hypothetical protein